MNEPGFCHANIFFYSIMQTHSLTSGICGQPQLEDTSDAAAVSARPQVGSGSWQVKWAETRLPLNLLPSVVEMSSNQVVLLPTQRLSSVIGSPSSLFCLTCSLSRLPFHFARASKCSERSLVGFFFSPGKLIMNKLSARDNKLADWQINSRGWSVSAYLTQRNFETQTLPGQVRGNWATCESARTRTTLFCFF